jgi:hypothetical protein
MIALHNHRIEPEVVARNFSAGWNMDSSTAGVQFIRSNL